MDLILCSGFGLGFYIPGVILQNRLNKYPIDVEIDVFETYLLKEKRDHVNTTKKAYHENFSMALLVQRIPMDIQKSMDFESIEILLEKWKGENRRDFIALSGHWVYILKAYREKMAPQAITIELLHVDSDYSPSWKSLLKFMPDYHIDCDESWLFKKDEDSVPYCFSVSDYANIDYMDREERFVIHGGGWGMGDYQKKINALEKNSIKLNVVAYEFNEIKEGVSDRRYFMNDPSWNAWEKDEASNYTFPPFSEIMNDSPEFVSPCEFHGLYGVIRKSKGIISKPGAGTLIDSLSSCTPVILLSSFGEHEKKN